MSEAHVPVFPHVWVEMALELINCPSYKLQLHEHSYLHSTVILVLTLLMVRRGRRGADGDWLNALSTSLPPCPPGLRALPGPPQPSPASAPSPPRAHRSIPQISLMIGMAHVLVVYRVLASALFSSSALPFLEEQVTTAVVVTGALVHYVTIVIMTKVGREQGGPSWGPWGCSEPIRNSPPQVNKLVALKLCDFGERTTQALLGDLAGGLRAGALELWSEMGEGAPP
ncbi:hypothetical protein P7K49_040269 [Saguinus oedipus]|uniref:Uncharacterized protein n=1 Tax=Saguinus oedipus TaxID=9490 RepID=A0ABQ9T8U1_SAGOE|nr:hypothetical protein P7K49_040269 [Saguinus oedipus]